MFEKRLKDLRSEKNLTQKQLADMLVLSKNSICEYEKGRSEPNIDTLIKLADIFNCSIDYLVGHANEFGVININASLDNEEVFLLSAFKNLSPEAKQYLISSAEFLLNYEKSKQ